MTLPIHADAIRQARVDELRWQADQMAKKYQPFSSQAWNDEFRQRMWAQISAQQIRATGLGSYAMGVTSDQTIQVSHRPRGVAMIDAQCCLIITKGILHSRQAESQQKIQQIISKLALALPFTIAVMEEARLDMGHSEIIASFGSRRTTAYRLDEVDKDPDAFIAHCLLLGDVHEKM